MTGKIVTFQADKNYGFIKGEDGNEHFFHRSEINGFWEEFKTGKMVTFEPISSPKGPRASKVELVEQYEGEL